jgi:hypothetical protein
MEPFVSDLCGCSSSFAGALSLDPMVSLKDLIPVGVTSVLTATACSTYNTKAITDGNPPDAIFDS